MIRIDAIWLAPGASDLRGGIDALLALVVRGLCTRCAGPSRLRLCQPAR